MSNLKDQVVFVTGGEGIIGKIIAIEFAKLGASVAIADLNEELLKTAVKEIEEYGGKVIGLIANVTDLESMRKILQKMVSTFGRIDIAVNNAGVVGIGSIEEIEPADWDKIISVNSKGVFVSTKAELEMMETQRFGCNHQQCFYRRKNGNGASVSLCCFEMCSDWFYKQYCKRGCHNRNYSQCHLSRNPRYRNVA